MKEEDKSEVETIATERDESVEEVETDKQVATEKSGIADGVVSKNGSTVNDELHPAVALLEGAVAPAGTKIVIYGAKIDELPVHPLFIDNLGRCWRIDGWGRNEQKLVCVGSLVK